MRSRAMFRAILVGATLVTTSASSSIAGDSSYRVQLFGGVPPLAGFEIEPSHSDTWEAVGFYAVVHATVRLPDGLPWIEYVARREYRDETGQTAVFWASSITCPSVRNLLAWLTELSPPRIEIAGVTPRNVMPDGARPRTYMADGDVVTIWGRGTQPDNAAATSVEVKSNAGAVASFGRAARSSLASCWTGTEPPVDGPVV